MAFLSPETPLAYSVQFVLMYSCNSDAYLAFQTTAWLQLHRHKCTPDPTVCLVRWCEPTRMEPTHPSQCLDGRQEGWVGSTMEYSLKMRVRFLLRNLRDGADPLGFRPLSVFFRRLPNSALRRHHPPLSPPPSLRPPATPRPTSAMRIRRAGPRARSPIPSSRAPPAPYGLAAGPPRPPPSLCVGRGARGARPGGGRIARGRADCGGELLEPARSISSSSDDTEAMATGLLPYAARAGLSSMAAGA